MAYDILQKREPQGSQTECDGVSNSHDGGVIYVKQKELGENSGVLSVKWILPSIC